MAKTLIEIDEQLMADAMAATGQKTKRAAVTQALEETVRRAAALRHLDDLRAGLLGDLDDPGVVAGAQR